MTVSTLTTPDPGDALDLLNTGFERGGMLTLVGQCEVDYDGRASSYLPPGERFSLKSRFESAQSKAKSNDLGIWSYSGSQSTPTATPTATPTPNSGSSGNGGNGSLATPTPSGGPNDPYDCSDFSSHAQAQQWFENHDPNDDPAGLDRDGDGQACES